MTISIDTGRKICEALGLDSNKVQSIDIHMSAQNITTAHVGMLVDDGIDIVFKEYELVPKETDNEMPTL